jgi:hypothetical protein
MIGCITAEGIRESNKAAHMAAGDHGRPGVPSAASGVAAQADDRYPYDPVTPIGHPPAGVEGRKANPPCAEDFRRPYITEGHATDSPGNVPSSLGPVPAPEVPGVPSRVLEHR